MTKTQVKKIGTSLGIILPKDFVKYHNLKVNDWVDIDDIIKVKKKEKK